MPNKNPCYKCEKHKLGCRTDCQEWQEYEKNRFAYYERHKKELMAYLDVNQYTTDAIGRMKRGRKR